MIRNYCDLCGVNIANEVDERYIRIELKNHKLVHPEKLICVHCKEKIVAFLAEKAKESV